MILSGFIIRQWAGIKNGESCDPAETQICGDILDLLLMHILSLKRTFLLPAQQELTVWSICSCWSCCCCCWPWLVVCMCVRVHACVWALRKAKGFFKPITCAESIVQTRQKCHRLSVFLCRDLCKGLCVHETFHIKLLQNNFKLCSWWCTETFEMQSIFSFKAK